MMISGIRYVYFFSDGMTQYTCQTPKFAQILKEDKVIETRIVGSEVVCGLIRTVLVYRTDELVSEDLLRLLSK